MSPIQDSLAKLQAKGWTLAALADETGNHLSTLEKWKSGATHPNNAKMVLMGLDALMRRRRIPKQRRYAPGSRRAQARG